MNYNKKMQSGLLKIAHFIISAVPILSKDNFHETLYVLKQMIEKLRKEQTKY